MGLKNKVVCQTGPRTITVDDWQRRRTLRRSCSAPSFTPLGMHYSMFGRSSSQASYQIPAFKGHTALDEGAEPEETVDTTKTTAALQLPLLSPALNSSVDSLPKHVLQAARAALPATKPPGIARALSESALRRTRMLPTPAHTPLITSADPFRRPHRVDEAGERINPPTKTDMIRQMVDIHPPVTTSRWRSLDHYNPGRHAGVPIRVKTDVYDAVAPRWK